MVNEFSQLQEVEAILLAGSHTAGTQDENSDYDLYFYSNKEVPVVKREEITRKFCDYMEINNQFWETEDDGILSDGISQSKLYTEILIGLMHNLREHYLNAKQMLDIQHVFGVIL
ncbi:nucleotidyltransferase domain-containing protein [Neobacillus ginsengisoli]|uniref:nucleotidyltransferase domain-containing protein n=1 Tax=Neobacillus ginsengisoli TaxID=904295 RepID=UPI003520B0F3